MSAGFWYRKSPPYPTMLSDRDPYNPSFDAFEVYSRNSQREKTIECNRDGGSIHGGPLMAISSGGDDTGELLGICATFGITFLVLFVLCAPFFIHPEENMFSWSSRLPEHLYN